MTFLGIDLGTSGLRALLIDAQGVPVGSASSAYTSEHPHDGWSEQDPQVWTRALDLAVAELSATHPEFCDLQGIGVAGHMHGATLLDANDQVLRPCILWNDMRAAGQARALDTMAGVRAVSANIVFAGFTAPKLAWVAEHEPEVFGKTAKVLLPAAFLIHHLTGRYVTDMSDSAGTAWLDVGARAWSDDLLKAGGMRRDQMPDLVEGSDAAGHLRADIAAAWGLTRPVVVAGGAGDNAAAACGIGAVSEGQGFVSLGTSGVVLVARDGFAPAPDAAVHTFCHAVPDKWYQMGVMLAATQSLNWLSSITGKSPAELTTALGSELRAPSSLRFYPYLSGERTPHNDADIRAGFTGIGAATTTEDMTQAVLEGVAYGLRDSLEALRSSGARIDQLMAIGGGAASAYWLKLIATVFDVPLAVPTGAEFGAAMGAARLGLLAATGKAPSAVLHPPEVQRVIASDPELVREFDHGYRRFRANFGALKALT